MPVPIPEEPSTSQQTDKPGRSACPTQRGHTLTPAMWSNIPSGAVATLSIIDTTLHLGNVRTGDLMVPPVNGFDILPAFPTWSFLLESSTGKKAVFDLGVARDLDSYSPPLSEGLNNTGWTVETTHDVVDILKNNGVDPSDINDVIWSHEHFDHIGDISRFPNTTNLVVGPGFKETNLPAWPTNPYSQLRDDYFVGRNVIQIDFEQQSPELQIGPFNAFDLWGDGAVYLLSTPGHTQSHLGALVRTTNEPEKNTFVLMGGDLCHHAGMLRPSPDLLLPPLVHFHMSDEIKAHTKSCPGEGIPSKPFINLNVKRGRKENEPFFDPASANNITLAMDTIKKTQKADASGNIFFIAAHDEFIRDVVDLYPKNANEWKAKGWREKTMWAFLADLAPAAAGTLK